MPVSSRVTEEKKGSTKRTSRGRRRSTNQKVRKQPEIPLEVLLQDPDNQLLDISVDDDDEDLPDVQID